MLTVNKIARIWFLAAGFLLMSVLAHPAFAACTGPAGAAGDIVFDNNTSAMSYCDGNLWVSMGKPASGGSSSTINAVNFDGSTSLERNGAFGNADSKKFTISFWMRSTASGAYRSIIHDDTYRFFVNITDTGGIELSAASTTGSTGVIAGTSGVNLYDGVWHHVLIAADVSASLGYIYVDGVSRGTFYSLNNVTLDMTPADWGVGVIPDSMNNVYVGDMADLWVDLGNYMDITNAANRAKFYSGGVAVDLGSDGSTPTGTAPVLYLSGTTPSWKTNKGTGGGFTVAAGALGTASSGPTAYTANGVYFDSSTWLKRGGSITGMTNSKQFTASVWFRTTNAGQFQTMFGSYDNGSVTPVISVGLYNDNSLVIRLDTSAGAYQQVYGYGSNLANGAWHNVLMSFDASTNTSYIYIDGVSAGTMSVANANFGFTAPTDWGVGADPFNSWNIFTGDMADLWVDSGTFINFSNAANRAKFYNNGHPVSLGSDGSTPTGTAPKVFLSGTTSAWHTNKGTGGGFTKTGTLTDSTAGPSGGGGSSGICSNPTGAVGDITFDTNTKVMTYCSVGGWTSMGAGPHTGGGCASPAGVAGALVFNTNRNAMTYCDGYDWVIIGKPATVPADYTTNLLAWYKLDDGSGTTATDSATSPHNGTLTNSPTWATGYVNGGLTFNGSNTYVDIPYVAAFNLTGDLTLSAWINATTTASTRRIVALPQNATAGSEQYALMLNAGQLQMWVSDGSVSTAYTATGTWHHVAGVMTGTTMKLYIDGVLVNTATNGNSRTAHGSGNLQIGRFSSSFPQVFSGTIDDVRVYNAALSDAQILQIYQATGGL